MRTQYQNPAVRDAFGILETLSADEKTRHLAEIRERALKNELSELAATKEEGKKEGREEGIRDKARETAKKMLSKGYDISEITELTGLSEDEITEMKKQK